jgi:hypothetical protein
VPDYFKALVEEELPKVLDNVKEQLAFDDIADDAEEKFDEIQRSIDVWLDYVETTYIGKVYLNLPRLDDYYAFCAPGPDLFTSGLFSGLKLGLPVGLGGAGGPVRPQAGLTQSGNPNFNPEKRSS